MKYTDSLAIGAFGERKIVEILDLAGISSKLNTSKKINELIQYDIECWLPCGHIFTIESKFDKMQKRTGNLAIEHFNTKKVKPSGISATTADLWAVVLADGVYLTSVDWLRKYCEENKPKKEIHCGGDDNAALWLYNSDEILQRIFFRIDNLSRLDLVTIILTLLNKV